MDDDEHPVASRAGQWAACILAWLCIALTVAAVVSAAAMIGMLVLGMAPTT